MLIIFRLNSILCLLKRFIWNEILSIIKESILKLNTARKQALSVIFLFQHRFPYNPYISHRPLNSLKYLAVEVSPVWTYISVLLGCHGIIKFYALFSKQESTNFNKTGQCIINSKQEKQQISESTITNVLFSLLRHSCCHSKRS